MNSPGTRAVSFQKIDQLNGDRMMGALSPWHLIIIAIVFAVFLGGIAGFTWFVVWLARR